MTPRAQRLFVCVDVRVATTPDGEHWSTHPSLSPASLEKYVATGIPVTLVARASAPQDVLAHRLDPSLDVHLLQGDDRAGRLVTRVRTLLGALRKVPVRSGDLVVLRVPELVSSLSWGVFKLRRARLVANVVADVGSIESRFKLGGGSVRARLVQACIRTIVLLSDAVIYVSESGRQVYAGRRRSPVLVASNVALPDGAFAPAARSYARPAQPVHLVSVGNHDSMVKGHDTLIRSVAAVRARGVDCTVGLVGGGERGAELVRLTHDLGVASAVTFHGFVGSVEEVRAIIDSADLYVQPSRSEGLPRSLIEAMARGVCSFGSRVGGIPDVIPGDLLFDPEDVEGLADLVQFLVDHPERATRQAQDGLQMAHLVDESSRPVNTSRFLVQVASARPVRGRRLGRRPAVRRRIRS